MHSDELNLAQRLLGLARSMGYGSTVTEIRIPMQFSHGNVVEMKQATIAESPVAPSHPGAIWLSAAEGKFYQAVVESEGAPLSWIKLKNIKNPYTREEASSYYLLGDKSAGGGTGGYVGSNYFGDAVQDISALRAVNTTQVPDKQMRYVEDVRALYAFDAQSQAADDGITVIQPTVGPGRWIRTASQSINGGTF